MTGPAIPPGPVTAAAKAMRRSQCHACAADLRPCDCTPDEYDLELALAALKAAEAAWPHGPPERPAESALAAAWRKGYGQGRDDEADGLPLRAGEVADG